ncbi:MAG: Fic family protein [Candidatus Parcubacteria bacterium]|nr:Fic family protein [Candidatus Parcubacteria bacterium]
MKNIIGTTKRHKNGYDYLSLFPFPSSEIKEVISDSLIQKSNRAQFLLGKLSGITLLLPDVDYFISSYVMKDAVSSSQIEGTKATMTDVLEYVADPSAGNDTDADDISHYVKALNYGLKRLNQEEFPFALRFIRELHSELLKCARVTHFADPGEFRKTQNWIGGTRPDNASFVPPPPEEIDDSLKEVENFIHTPFAHPIIDAGLLHAQFETIHPFLDGNGRTGRLLVTFYLIHNKYLELPALFLSSYFKKHQKVYYQRLNGYHNGDILPWLDFFTDAVIDTAEEAIEISKKITKLRDNDLAIISRFSKSTSEIALHVIQKLYKDPIVSSSTIQEWIGQTKPGTMKFIDKLVDSNILALHRKGEGSRPSLYVHTDYLKIFTEK